MTEIREWHAAWIALFVATGCSASAAPVAVSGALESPVVPTPSAVPSVLAPTDLAKPASEAETPFVTVAHVAGASRLFAVNGAVLVTRLGASRQADDLGVVAGKRITFFTGLDRQASYASIVDAGGSWPEGVFVLATGTTGRTGVAATYALRDGKWNSVAPVSTSPSVSSVGMSFIGIARTGQSTVAVEMPLVREVNEPSFVTLDGPAFRGRFTRRSSACQSNPDELFHWRTSLVPETIGSAGNGDLISFGTSSDASCKELAATEIWRAADAKSSVLPIAMSNPPANSRKTAAVGARIVRGVRRDAWLFAGDVAHYDGTTWEPVARPEGAAGVFRGGAATDGTLYVIDEKGAYRRTVESGVWEPLGLPEGLLPDDLVVGDDGEVWLLAGDELLRLRLAGETKVTKLDSGAASEASPSDDAASERAARKAIPVSGSAGCAHNLVVLYAFTKTTPDDYDFPLTRKALRGHTELKTVDFVITRDFGQRFLAALTTSFGEAQSLSRLVEKGVAGAKPQVLCADPEIIRHVKLNLATGGIE